MDFYHILIHLHSLLRWALLIMALTSVFLAARYLSAKAGILRGGMKPALWTMVTAHLQLIFGLVLYFVSPKVIFSGASMKEPVLRFFLVEHFLVMLIAIILITIGYIKAKKATDPKRRYRSILVYYLIALILFLSRIPWPFLGYGGKWI